MKAAREGGGEGRGRREGAEGVDQLDIHYKRLHKGCLCRLACTAAVLRSLDLTELRADVKWR